MVKDYCSGLRLLVLSRPTGIWPTTRMVRELNVVGCNLLEAGSVHVHTKAMCAPIMALHDVAINYLPVMVCVIDRPLYEPEE